MTGVVEQYYDSAAEQEWHRLERHRTEYGVTLLALQDHLPPTPAHVLDAGGGPGRYALDLTRQGYTVTLLDLSAGLLAFARQKAAETGLTLHNTVHASATDLGRFTMATFDAVLLMGPLYHLTAPEDRQAALREAWRVLKPGGVIFAAFITRYAPFRSLAVHDPAWILSERAEYEQILHTGVYHARPEGGFTTSYFAHPSEVAPLLAEAGFQQVALVGCESALSMIEAQVNATEGAVWDAWVALNYQLGQDPALHGAAEHLLYIGHKGKPTS